MIFSRKWSVGNATLDYEHAKLHAILNQIACSIKARDIAAMLAAFGRLESCLCAYFEIEEKIARSHNFDFSQHRLMHQDLLHEFLLIKDELTDQINTWPAINENGYVHNLMDCLVQHVQDDSVPLKRALNAHPCECNAGLLRVFPDFPLTI